MSDPSEYELSRPVSADASTYVRNCQEPTLLGLHPGWIVLVIIAIFITAPFVRFLCLVGFLFIVQAKRQQSTLFDTARRARRKLAGVIRKPFRSY